MSKEKKTSKDEAPAKAERKYGVYSESFMKDVAAEIMDGNFKKLDGKSPSFLHNAIAYCLMDFNKRLKAIEDALL